MAAREPFDLEASGDGAPPAGERPPGGEPGPRRRSARAAPAAPEPRARRGGGSETVARVAWAVPWVAFAVTVIAVGGGLFAIAMAGLAALGIVELYRMIPDARPLMPVAVAVAAALVGAAYWGSHLQIVLVGAVSFPLMFAVAVARPGRRGVVAAIAVTTLAIAWIGVPFAHAVLLRELPEHGGALLIDVLVATFLADTAAYAGGKLLGRHRLAPSLSPNKTVEGLACGFVGGALGFWFAGLYQDWLPGIDALLIGMAVAAVAPIGDLFESMVKRDLGVKDSGNAFGPHGGLLDRVDAVLFTIVAGYYLALAFVY